MGFLKLLKKQRYISSAVLDFLMQRAVFIGGPRQVGKTTLALSLIGPEAEPTHPAYLNWDHFPSAQKIKKTELPVGEKLLVFDEIHKFKNWKRWIKGVIDVEKLHRKIVVTGSARLDVYQKGGDSLFGRYRYVRLHPFSLNEYSKYRGDKEVQSLLEELIQFGGFPEPLFSADIRFLKLWQRERQMRIVREDIRDITQIQNLTSLELMMELLPEKVGNPLSIKSLCGDLEVDHKTVKRWLLALEAMYFLFRISPFGSKKIRAVKKEQKMYLWDWSTVQKIGERWENMVASQLLKYCHFIEDTEGETMELRFLRDTDKREIDFVIVKNKEPLFAVECKTGDKSISPHIHYFAQRTNIPTFYQVHRGIKSFQNGNIWVLPFTDFCEKLNMP
jgi:predicted AAA+ superfamily ATPase